MAIFGISFYQRNTVVSNISELKQRRRPAIIGSENVAKKMNLPSFQGSI